VAWKQGFEGKHVVHVIQDGNTFGHQKAFVIEGRDVTHRIYLPIVSLVLLAPIVDQVDG
jgi:hypothetical protein